MKHDPVTGPLSRAEFQKLVTAPHGEAVKVIKKFDPLYGLEPGEPIEWWVTFKRSMVTETGRAVVKAATLQEAQKLAEELKANDIDWEPDYRSGDCGEITELEPRDDR